MRMRAFEDVIASIGLDNFSTALSERLRRAVAFQQIIVCEYVRGAPVSILMSEGCRDHADLNEMTKKYLSTHFRRASTEEEADGAGQCLRVHFAEVNDIDLDPRDTASKPLAYTMFGSIGAIIARRGDVSEGRYLVILIVRDDRGGSFRQAEKQFILEHSGIIAALIDRHCAILHGPACPLERWTEHLMLFHGRLSQREAMVCAYALMGYSNEATALNLGVSVNSAITYRRRAFAKLNIKTQGELFPLLFFPKIMAEAPARLAS